MADKIVNWGQDAIEFLIEEYKKRPCLWKIKSKDYHNRIKRTDALESLLKAVQEFEDPTSGLKVMSSVKTVEVLKKKIDNLRSTFRREHGKVKASTKSGIGAEEVYEPSLWYYQNLLFIGEMEEARGSSSNLLETPNSACETRQNSIDEPNDNNEDSMNVTDTQCTADEEHQQVEMLEESSSNTTTSTPNCIRKRKARRPNPDNLLRLAEEHLRAPDDSATAFANNVAHQLRQVQDAKQRLIAEKLISDVLFQARLGSLELSSCIGKKDSYVDMIIKDFSEATGQK